MLRYPDGVASRLSLGGHILRPGDEINGHLLDHFEVSDRTWPGTDEQMIIGVLRPHGKDA